MADLPEDDTYRGQMDWALWRRLIRRARPYARELGSLAGLGLLVAAIDTALPIITAALIDDATTGGHALARYGSAYGSMLVVMAACVFGFIVLAGRISTGVAHDLRVDGFARLQELSFSYFDKRPVGWLVSRLTSDCGKLSGLLPWFLLDMSWGPALAVGIVGAMLWMHWPLALVVLGIVPPLALVSVLFQRRLLDSSRLIRKTNSQITAAVSEALMGVRTTKVLVRERDNLGEFQGLTGQLMQYSVRNALQSAVYLPMVISLGSVGVGLALWRGGLEVGGEISLGTLVAFMQFATLFSMPIQDLARRLTELQAAQAAAERVQSLLDTEPEIGDSPEVVAALAAQRDQPKPGRAIDGGRAGIGEVEFRDVSFWYEPGQPVLQHCNLRATAGETIALVGPTGGGKSTIVSLLARFYEVREGAIVVDGIDTRDRSLHWLQSSLGIVLQAPHLFSGTIADNIRYGRLDATDDEIREAARVVCANDFISRLPKGYATEVGEGGGRLSTGQRQLVSLARAVLSDPQIMVLDEATSSVDTETEAALQAGIEAALRGRIAFVIAHRLSTIRRADQILVVEGGRIVERGRHDELLALGGKYRALYQGHHARERSDQAARLAFNTGP